MVKMRFHWKKDNEKGSFTVTAPDIDDCIKIAKEEIKEDGVEIIDWYVI